MRSIATFTHGAVEEEFAFYKNEALPFEYFRQGCAVLFDGSVDTEWIAPYTIQEGDFEDKVILNRAVVGPDVTAEDIILCGMAERTRQSNVPIVNVGSAILAAA